jgi:hypothetical protein
LFPFVSHYWHTRRFHAATVASARSFPDDCRRRLPLAGGFTDVPGPNLDPDLDPDIVPDPPRDINRTPGSRGFISLCTSTTNEHRR